MSTFIKPYRYYTSRSTGGFIVHRERNGRGTGAQPRRASYAGEDSKRSEQNSELAMKIIRGQADPVR